MSQIVTVNPATDEPIAEYEAISSNRLREQIRLAEEAYAGWRTTGFEHRSGLLNRAAEILRDRKREFGELITREMGKPIGQGVGEVEKCAWTLEYYAEHGPSFLEPETIATEAGYSAARFDPLGAILAVMPWNFPFLQVFRFAAPTLMAGNVGLLKHASNVTGCALAVDQIFREAGFPEGVFQTLVITGKQVPEVLDHDIVQAVTLTGSDGAGRAVAKAAGERLKRSVLELGGSDPFVVFADAPIEQVAKAAVKARCRNSGQSCIAAKRIIVDRSVLPEFTEAVLAEIQGLSVGDPMNEGTDLGPLAKEEILIEVNDQAHKSIHVGARLLAGGERIDRPGNFYQPTVLGGVGPDMPAFEEETFGPLAALIAAEDGNDAVRLANQTPFGLGASLWTRDVDRARDLVPQIDAGMVFINAIPKSDPRVPFGGIKQSGYGRELSSHGIREFVNVKTMWIGELE